MVARVGVAGSLLVCLAVIAASSLSFEAPAASAEDSLSPAELVRATVANEVAANNNDSIKHMFRDRKQTPLGSQTRIFVETRDALAGMTIAYNDKPLTAKQLHDEEGRLAGLEGDPAQLKRKQRQQKEDAERTQRIVRALPDAFLYEVDGEEIGTPTLGHEGTKLVRLKFRPNRAYRPPSRVEDVLVGMAGLLLIDPEARRIARIDGTLFKEVSFGWGILGHLDKGGHFFVEQEDVGDSCWEISRMRLEFTGKILLFKSLAIKSDEVFSDFKRVPADTTFVEGVRMLEQEEEKMAQSGGETAQAERKSR